jgi:hypothetical protein
MDGMNMKRVAILMAVLALAAACDDDSPTQPSNTGRSCSLRS